MYRKKRAKSVIHSIAHHGVSALSWLHPRLGEECKKIGIKKIEINLLTSSVVTKGFNYSRETSNAINALTEKFLNIARAEKFEKEEIFEAKITFGFENDNWPSFCVAEMSNSEKESVSVKVDGFGNKYGLLSKYSKKYS